MNNNDPKDNNLLEWGFKILEDPSLGENYFTEDFTAKNIEALTLIAKRTDLFDKNIKRLLEISNHDLLLVIAVNLSINSKYSNEIFDKAFHNNWNDIIAVLISHMSDPYNIVLRILNEDNVELIDYLDVSRFGSDSIRNANYYIRDLDKEKLSKLLSEIESLYTLRYETLATILSNENVPKEFVDRVIHFLYLTLFEDEKSYNTTPINIAANFLNGKYKLTEDQKKEIENMLVRFYKEHNNFYIGREHDFYNKLLVNYKFISLESIKDIYHSIRSAYKVRFENSDKDIIKLLSSNISTLQKDKKFMYDVINYSNQRVLHKLLLFVSDNELLVYIALIIMNEERLLDFVNNPNINAETLYIIYKLLNIYNIKPTKENSIVFKTILDRIKISKTHINYNEKKLISSMVKSISKYIKAGTKIESDTSLIQVTDDISLVDKHITIKPDNFDLIEKQNKDTIYYGTYPLYNVSDIEERVINLLYSTKQLDTEYGKFDYIYNGKFYSLKVYVFNNNRYIRVKNGKEYRWIKFAPVKWKVNHENKTLDMIETVHGVTTLEELSLHNYLNNVFKRQVFEPYVLSKEDENEQDELNTKRKIREKKFKLQKQKEEEAQKKEKIKEAYNEVLAKLQDLQEAIDSLENQTLIDISNLKSKIRIPDELLIIKVEDHLEFNPEYIPFLKYIDLSLISSSNLKISGLNLSQTNIKIDPQKVYKKDLSNCILSDNNIIFASFNEVDLRGANIENETESAYDLDKAIIDENTKLPPKLVEASKKNKR